MSSRCNYISDRVRRDSLPDDTAWMKGLDDSPAPPFDQQLRDAPGGVLIMMWDRESHDSPFEFVNVVRRVD